MLSIGTISAGNQAQREYHERQLAVGRDDYYRESEGPAGTWVGSKAEALGLSGEVNVEAFRRMLDGQNPATGEDLAAVSALGRRTTVAFDLAFSAPKSVSLLRMAADEATSKAVDQAHERAVMAALSYVEGEGWKGRQLQDGQRVTVDGTGVVGVLYRHETTRNADPQLHSHAVLANLVDDGTGRVRAINSTILYAQAKTAGSVYQAVLRGELGRELGIEFDTPVNGLADIKGFDRGLIDTYSTRRAEILEGLARAGFSAGGAAAERVALESRRAKDMQMDHGLWRVEVREALARDGFSQQQVQALVRTPAERELVVAGGGPDEGPPRRSLEERLQAAPLHTVTAERSTADARAVRQAAMSVAEGYTSEEVGRALGEVFEDRRLAQVAGGERPRWTTERHLQLEQRVQRDTLGRMAETTAPRITAPGYEPPTVTPDGHALSEQQRRVLQQMLTSGHGVEVIRARAGAGKTTIAGLARAEFEAHGMKVVGVAPTLQALAELDDVGLTERDSLARTAFSDGEFSKVMRTMDHQTVVLVDEAAMAQTKEIAPLLQRAAERGAKVVAIGDDVQLAAVGAGGWFRYLAEHQETEVLELTEVHRQRDPVERDRLNQFHRGDVAGWTRWADQHDRIDIQPTVQDAYTATVARYEFALDGAQGNVDEVVVMAPENAHRRVLNEQLRRIVVERGVVDRSAERNYGGLLVAPGERLVAMQTVTEEGSGTRLVENGERFEVLSVSRLGVRALAVAGARRGETVRVPAEVFEPDADGRKVDHAYARTVHKAQGMTADRSVLFAPDPAKLGRNLAYVGLTRTRDRADLVTVAPDRPAGLERLVRGMAERRDHQAAVAIADPDKLNPQRLSRMSDQELDEHRHALLTEAREAMTRLARLDREARGAWAGSRDARVDAQLVAERDQLAAKVNGTERHLAEHDPTGTRADRGLMEHTIRQALERDRAQVQRLDDRLAGRAIVAVDEADDMQRRIRRDRAPVQDYLDELLRGLDRVHGAQIDRTPAGVDPLSVPEHERPSLALRQEQGRASGVRELTLQAAQQLGTGHPQIVSWLERHAPRAEPTVQREAWTAPQRMYADALGRWRAAKRELAELGGPGLDRDLQHAQDHLRAAQQRHKAAADALAHHEQEQPSRLRRSAGETWREQRTLLQRSVDRARASADDAQNRVDALEHQLGRPADQVLEDLQRRTDQVDHARRDAVTAERALLRSGVAGAGQRRALSLLGRRNELQNAQERRRYDELAGRIAVHDVVQCQHAESNKWTPTTAGPDRDVARWRADHGRPLDDAMQSDRGREPDRGHDPDR